MNRFCTWGLVALALVFASSELSSAKAQYGYGHHDHHHHCVPSYGRSLSYGGYQTGYSPYGSVNAYGSNFYGAPGLSVTRSSYYGSPIGTYGLAAAPITPFGLGGYGNLGYPSPYPPARTPPRVQLRIGF